MNNENAEIVEDGGTALEAIPEVPAATAIIPYQGIACAPFSPESAEVLLAPIATEDIEIRPDGLLYLPEIKYRRALNKAFGPGAWAIWPMEVTFDEAENMLFYRGSLFVHGRFVAEAIGEQQYFPNNKGMSRATAAESAKSNCLMRCCKDLGIASELWDPSFIKRWLGENAQEVWVENVAKGPEAGKTKKMWRKKSDPLIDAWPWREKADGRQAQQQPRQREDDKRPANVDRARNGEQQTQDAAPTIISFQQAKRFKKLAAENGWSEAMYMVLLEKLNFKSHEEITRNEYERLCKALTDKSLRETVKGKLEAARGPKPSAPAPTPGPTGEEVRQSIIDDPYGTGQSAPAASTPESTASEQRPGCITQGQAEALIEVLRSREWSKAETKELLTMHGFASIEEITPKLYAKVRNDARNSNLRNELATLIADRRAAA